MKKSHRNLSFFKIFLSLLFLLRTLLFALTCRLGSSLSLFKILLGLFISFFEYFILVELLHKNVGNPALRPSYILELFVKGPFYASKLLVEILLCLAIMLHVKREVNESDSPLSNFLLVGMSARVIS